MNSATPSISATPVVPNAWHAFGGVWRLTFRRYLTPMPWLGFVGALAVLALVEVAQSRLGQTGRFYNWATNFYLLFVVPILAFFSGAGAIRDEMKSASVDYVLIRPVRRPAFVAFKFFSHLACVQVGFLLTLCLVVTIAGARQIGSLGAAFPWMLLGQGIVVTTFTALGFLSGAITSRYFVIGFLYAFIVEIGIGNIPTQLNRFSMLRPIRELMHNVLPGPPADASSNVSFLSVSVPLIAAALMIAITATLHTLRELAGGPAKES